MYYVNYGRWNNNIVGPFADLDVAQAYADQSSMSAPPVVVSVEKPVPAKLVIAEEACKRTFYVTMHRVRGAGEIKVVVVASSESAARDVANVDTYGYFATADVREV